MAVLFIVCFTSNLPICLGLSFWIHAKFVQFKYRFENYENRCFLQSSVKTKSKCPTKSLLELYKLYPSQNNLPHHSQATPFKILSGRTCNFMKLFGEMQHSER